jgi:hypothetical protein
VCASQRRHAVSADLICRIAVGGNPIGASDHRLTGR